MLYLLMLLSVSAQAYTDPTTVKAMCNVLNKSKAYTCSLQIKGGAAAMFIESKSDPSDEELVQANQLTQAFFSAGGQILERHTFKSDKAYKLCTPMPQVRAGYNCETALKKHSLKGKE